MRATQKNSSYLTVTTTPTYCHPDVNLESTYYTQPEPSLVKDKNQEFLHPTTLLSSDYLERSMAPSEILVIPSRKQYHRLEQEYLTSLSPRKRNKALINQETYNNIASVLKNPDNYAVGTAQFRFWVRKMFTLSYEPTVPLRIQSEEDDEEKEDSKRKPVVLHNGLPVAIKSQIYDILSLYHELSGHAGRDKTTVLVRQHYSWIPKCLVGQFVKICPTCISRRPGSIPLSSTPLLLLSPHTRTSSLGLHDLYISPNPCTVPSSFRDRLYTFSLEPPTSSQPLKSKHINHTTSRSETAILLPDPSNSPQSNKIGTQMIVLPTISKFMNATLDGIGLAKTLDSSSIVIDPLLLEDELR